jgi:hypothetical protein
MLFPSTFGRISKDGSAPGGRVAFVFFAGTINLNKTVNRTVSRAREVVLVSHDKVEIANQHFRIVRVRETNSENFGGRENGIRWHDGIVAN